MYAQGGPTFLGGRSSYRRDEVGIVSVRDEPFVAPADWGVTAQTELTPPEQFTLSLRRVLENHDKFELVLSMITTYTTPEHEGEEHTVTTGQAFARSVFTQQHLHEWRRLVEERYWKSISFCHHRENRRNDLIPFETAAGEALVAVVAALREDNPRHHQRQDDNLAVNPLPALARVDRNQAATQERLRFREQGEEAQRLASPPISEEEEEAMWRGLIEPCRSRTQRLELRGEFTVVQARVLSSVFQTIPCAKSSAATRPLNSTSSSSGSRLRVLCLSNVVVSHESASVLGEIVHGASSPSFLKELSLSKCAIAGPRVWSQLLGHLSIGENRSQRPSEGGDDMEMVVSQANTDPRHDSDGSMNIVPDNVKQNAITCSTLQYDDRKPSSIDSGRSDFSFTSSSFLSSDGSLPASVHLSLRALYLSDCNLTISDVTEIVTALKRHPRLKTLVLNGAQKFLPSQIDPLLLALLRDHVNLERVQLPNGLMHDPRIQLYSELNRCGRRLLRARRDAAHGVGPATPEGLWAFVLERIRRLRGLTPTSRINAIHYLVQEMHGIASVAGGSGGTLPPSLTSSSNNSQCFPDRREQFQQRRVGPECLDSWRRWNR